MRPRLASWPGRIALALAAAAVPAVGACAEHDATAGVTLSQLPDMVLQPEDLPAGLSYEVHPAWPEAEASPPPVGRVGDYRLEAYLPHSAAKEGDLVCVTGSLELYESMGAAKARSKEFEEWSEKASEPPPSEEVELRRISVPSLADQTGGYFLSARSNWCRWEDTQMEAVIVSFRKGRLWAAVATYTLEHGASPDEAIALARKQLARIEAALVGE